MEQFRPIPEGEKQKQTPQQRGEGIRGVPPPAKPQQERGERQPLPSVWEVLERKVRIHEEFSSNRITEQEYDRKLRALNRAEWEKEAKRTPRDHLILELYVVAAAEPTGTLPVPLTLRKLSLEEFQQFRSRIEPMSEEEIREEIRKADKGFERKAIILRKGFSAPKGPIKI
jgi:hypothetical protein